MLSTSPKSLFLSSLAVVLLAAGGYFYATRPAPGPASSVASSTTVTLEDGTVITIPAGATLTELTEPAPQAQIPAPDYKKPIAYSASTSAEVRAAVEAQFAENKKQLAASPRDFNAWMNLAILHKIGGDYRGAEAIWLYATKQWPTSNIAFNNLADLYQNFLQDPVKAKFYSDQAAKLQAQ